MEQSIQTLIVINLFSVLLQDKLIVAKEGEKDSFLKGHVLFGLRGFWRNVDHINIYVKNQITKC